MNPGQGSHRIKPPFHFVPSAAFLFICLLPFPVSGQSSSPPPQHPAAVELFAVPHVTIPDVRGRPLAEAQRTLEAAGLNLGKISSAAGPGIIGTVMQQEPIQYTTVIRGSVFNLILVAPSVARKPDHSDAIFGTQVPSLIGLTQNQASNRLEKLRLQLGSVILGQGKQKVGTIYDQKPTQGSWVKEGSRIDVAVVQSSSSSTPSG